MDPNRYYLSKNVRNTSVKPCESNCSNKSGFSDCSGIYEENTGRNPCESSCSNKSAFSDCSGIYEENTGRKPRVTIQSKYQQTGEDEFLQRSHEARFVDVGTNYTFNQLVCEEIDEDFNEEIVFQEPCSTCYLYDCSGHSHEDSKGRTRCLNEESFSSKISLRSSSASNMTCSLASCMEITCIAHESFTRLIVEAPETIKAITKKKKKCKVK